MDTVGLLPRTQRKNRYIFPVVDHFTKQVQAYALQNKKTLIIAGEFNKFISRFGVPYIIHTE